MWWAVIVSGVLFAVLVSGFSAGAARMFGSEQGDDYDPWEEDDDLERDEWERDEGEGDDW